MDCVAHSDCGRFECYSDGVCTHLGAFQIHPIWNFALLMLPIAVGMANASSFGNVAVQIFVLILLYNYGKKQAGSVAQPLSAGIFIANAIGNSTKRHPKLNTLLVDYHLAILFIPNMISGLIAGIHFKDYLPPLAITIFTIFQLGVLILSTTKKYKQLKQLQDTQQKVSKDSSNQSQEEKDFLTSNVTIVDDQLIIDYEQIFTLIQKSPNKQQFLKHLPEELKKLDFTVGDNQIKVIDFCSQNFDETKIKQVKQNLEDEKKAEDKNLIFDLITISVIVLINLGVLYFKGTHKNENNIVGCKGNYWSAFTVQFIVNFVIYVAISLNSKISFSKKIKLLILSFVGGFLLGLIGMGVALFLVLFLVKLNVSPGGMPSVGATLPIIFAVVTSTGSLIQLITGNLDLQSIIVYSVLGFIGQKIVSPIAGNMLHTKNLTVKLTLFASYFQKLLLVLFIGSQLPKIIKTPILAQLTPHPYCS